jgi:hypothetical protein
MGCRLVELAGVAAHRCSKPSQLFVNPEGLPAGKGRDAIIIARFSQRNQSSATPKGWHYYVF